ncbi:MAG TPA: zf-TFIIB domain-containing protein [Thermomicrobiales bacterium]|nr:zf-TFIIB domain-containing protein [Thermomicrobiales bacterium]
MDDKTDNGIEDRADDETGGEAEEGPDLRCPLDDTELEQAPLGDVLLSYCPECQGIWLTRDAFEQLIEQATRAAPHEEAGAVAPAGDDETAARHPNKGLRAILADLFG